MVIQVERFLSVQKCTRLCRSLTDCELVLAEESKELGTHWRKGTSSNDWQNAGIWSYLAMFLHVIFYLKVVLRHCALELHHHRSSGDHFTAQRCAEAADAPICVHLASPVGGRALHGTPFPYSSLWSRPAVSLAIGYWDKSNITLRWGGTDGGDRAG